MLSLSNYVLRINILKFATLLLLGFFVFSYVGLAPFSRDSFEESLADIHTANIFRQAFFVLIWFGSVALLYFRKCELNIYQIKTFLFFILWCGLSFFWSDHPDLTVKRLFLLLLNTSMLFFLVSIIPKKNCLNSLSQLYFYLLVISLLSVLFIGGAVHQNPEMFDSGLAGNWKGVFTHKNEAAPAATLAIFFSIYKFIETKNRKYLFVIPLALVFIYFTRSKTTLALTLPSIIFGFAIMKLSNNPRFFNVFRIASITFFLLILSMHEYLVAEFLKILDDPEAFTGRSTIWNLMYLAISEHPILGIGYGAVWYVGEDMKLAEYAFGWVDWVFLMAQGHNSYLDILLSTGFIGLIIFSLVFIIGPFSSIKLLQKHESGFIFLFFSVWFFSVFHSFLESNFVQPDKARWMIFLLLYFYFVKGISRKQKNEV